MKDVGGRKEAMKWEKTMENLNLSGGEKGKRMEKGGMEEWRKGRRR